MNEGLISNWNSVVEDTDTVYHLGDFALGKWQEMREIIIRLNGYKILIEGSHEYSAIRNKELFEKIVPWESIELKLENGNKQEIFMAHHCYKVWPISHYGCWHLFGHSHGGLNNYAKKEGKLLDVGIDSYNKIYGGYYPFSLDEILEIMQTRPPNYNMLEG